MQHCTKILAAMAIAPLMFLAGCSDGDLSMEEFEEEQMQEPPAGQDGMQSAPPPEGDMQQAPPEGGMQQPPADDGMGEQGGSLEPEGDDNF